MTWYKNVGALPWKRANGKSVGPGNCFEATPREQARIARRTHYRARLQEVEAPPEPNAPAGAASQKQADKHVWPAEWALKMEPPLYLKVHPKGPQASLAQKLVDARDAAKDSDDGNGEDEDQ